MGGRGIAYVHALLCATSGTAAAIQRTQESGLPIILQPILVYAKLGTRSENLGVLVTNE